MNTIAPPDETEFAKYYVTYISQVPDGDIRRTLETQETDTLQLLRGISEERSLHKYAAGKWTIREVVSHINDTERMFVFRALWFARSLGSELPSFDQEVAMAAVRFDDRPLSDLVDEFRTIRESSVRFFRGLPDDAWAKRGIASGKPFTVRALAYITAGHLAHHMRILREKYL